MAARTKILIVDDVDQMRDLLSKIVDSLGKDSIECATGVDAIRIAKEEKNNLCLVLLDLGLPDMEGLEVAKEIQKLDCGIKICIVSGQSDFENIKSAQKFGAVSFLVKPIRPQMIKERLESLLAA